jgi:hypothetical protein
MTAHVSDFKKSSLDIVLDLINEQNGTSFTHNHMGFSDPIPGEGKTTSLVVTAKVGSGYRGSYGFNYNRVPLTEVPDLAEEVTHEVDIAKYSDILGFINAKFGVNVGLEDVTVNGVDLTEDDPAYSSEFDEVNSFAIAAKGKSLVWLGSTNLSLTRVRQDLSAVWANNTLDGLYPPGYESIVYPSDAFMVQAPDGSVRTTSDGSIRTFAGISPQ